MLNVLEQLFFQSQIDQLLLVDAVYLTEDNIPSFPEILPLEEPLEKPLKIKLELKLELPKEPKEQKEPKELKELLQAWIVAAYLVCLTVCCWV